MSSDYRQTGCETHLCFQITDKLDNVESKLMSRRPEELLDDIDALKRKTEQNREQAREAREAADSATDSSTDAQTVRLQMHGQ